jgi:hypothetical protein
MSEHDVRFGYGYSSSTWPGGAGLGLVNRKALSCVLPVKRARS